MLRNRFVLLFFVTLLLVGCATTKYVQRPDVQAFVDKMHVKHGFDREALCSLFSQTHPDPSVMKMMQKPAERHSKATPWYKYRAIFLKPERIQAGVKFWQQNAKALAVAQDRYGVPPQIIVAIIGVETQYGKNKGGFKVLNTLTNLAFDYPRRAKFFQDELEQYLLLTREQGLDPLDLEGSYAGAIGLPQFMPSNYRVYGIDFSSEHQADLVNNPEDAILSVANYFKAHGWQPGAPVVMRANVAANSSLGCFIVKSLKPHWNIRNLVLHGITPQRQTDSQALATLMVFDVESGPEYWIGFKNFYVITRYNSSRYYAMAVYQLAEKILQGKEKGKSS
jgi:membrane-bound lytic murein transglycosylase B